jgi:L-alanine-DL-glutamate epimerase-like enolase superfamily enzyme
MQFFSRRSLLKGAGMGGTALLSSQVSATSAQGSADNSGLRLHPLEGISRENLKITDIRVTLLSCELPPEKRWVTATSQTWKTDEILVETFTDKGIVGIGAACQYGGPEQVKSFIEERIKPGLIVKNPFDVVNMTGAWNGPWGRWQQRPGPQAGWAGVDATMWDIIGKAKNKPVYKILSMDGKPDPRVRVYASGGVEYAWYKRPEDLIDEAARVKDEGYPAFKFRIGTEWKNSGITVQRFIPYMQKVRQTVGNDLQLALEGNQRLVLEQWLELCPVLEDLKFLWLEEPVNRFVPGAVDNYLRIKEALPRVKISGGEMLMNRFEFKEWIDRGAHDIVQPGCNVMGITEAWQVARLAHLRGRICVPVNWWGGLSTMANVALTAAVPNRLYCELNHTFNPLRLEVFKDPLVPKKGVIQIPDKPGFGVELVKDVAQKFPFLPGNFSRRNPELPN